MVPPPADSAPDDAPDDPADPTWPPSFPHLEIDRLIDRLERGQTLDTSEAYRLLALVAQEAQRLRATAVRLATSKLSEADRQARQIVAEAQDHAAEMRAVGMTVLNSRLDEGDRLLATLREAFQVERRASDLARAEQRREWAFRSPGDVADD